MSSSPHATASPWDSVVATGPILRPADAAEYIGVSLPAYYAGAAKGRFPSPIKIGNRASGVPRPWLDAFIGASAANVGAAR